MNLISSSAPRNSSLPAPIVLCISISSNYILPPLSKFEVILIAMEVSLQKVLVFFEKRMYLCYSHAVEKKQS